MRSWQKPYSQDYHGFQAPAQQGVVLKSVAFPEQQTLNFRFNMYFSQDANFGQFFSFQYFQCSDLDENFPMPFFFFIVNSAIISFKF